MVTKKYSFIITFAVVLCFFHGAATGLELNGVATLKQLGSEVFYGGLLVQTPTTDAEELLGSSQPMTLEIKVISTISKRSWSSLWTQGVAINNSIDFFSANADDFSKMLAAFKGPLAANDIVRIERLNNTETRVTVNNVTLVDGLSPEVFLLCLRSWIGSVPFSGTFKEQVLGLSSYASQLASYNTINPMPARKSIVASWVNASEVLPPNQGEIVGEEVVEEALQGQEVRPFNTPETPEEIEAAEATIATVKPEISVAAPAVSPSSNETTARLPVREESEESSSATEEQETAARVSAHPEISTRLPPASIPSSESVAEADTAAKNGPSQPAATATVAAVALPASGDSADEEFSTQALIAQQRYIQSVRREIYSVTEYPLSAMRRKIEGTVGLSITVNAQGDLERVEITEEAGFSPFNKAILRATQSAAPFPPFPTEMKQTRFTIVTPFAFVLQQ